MTIRVNVRKIFYCFPHEIYSVIHEHVVVIKKKNHRNERHDIDRLTFASHVVPTLYVKSYLQCFNVRSIDRTYVFHTVRERAISNETRPVPKPRDPGSNNFWKKKSARHAIHRRVHNDCVVCSLLPRALGSHNSVIRIYNTRLVIHYALHARRKMKTFFAVPWNEQVTRVRARGSANCSFVKSSVVNT